MLRTGGRTRTKSTSALISTAVERIKYRHRVMPAFCPLCASDDYTTDVATPDGESLAHCADRSHGLDGFTWDPTPPKPTNVRSDGIGAELDIWDKLLECVPADGDPHSYGEVEDRLFSMYPAEAATLQNRYGHKWRDGNKSEGRYSMSVYLALRLRELEKEGHLALSWGPATGPWAYNEIISHWKMV